MLQWEEPELNLVRAALGALASAFAGAQGTTMPSYDEAYEIPSDHAQSLALGSLQILAEETDITKTVDPLGGSYYIEWLTNQMEQEIKNKMAEVERHGGAVDAIESGFISLDILHHFYHVQREIASGERTIVRRNKYKVEEDPWERLQLYEPNPEAERCQIEKLTKVKAERDNSEVERCLNRLEELARGEENLMPCLIEAVKAYASIGEMVKVLRRVWGTHQEIKVF